MYLNWTNIRVTPGSLRSERLPAPLQTQSFMVRPDTLAEGFCKAARHLGAEDAHLVKKPSVMGPWARLFRAEQAYVYAELAAFHVDDAAFAFETVIETDPPAAMHQLSALSKRLKDWISRLPTDPASKFSKQLQQLNEEADLDMLLDRLAAVHPLRIVQVVKDNPTLPNTTNATGALGEARALETALRSTHTLLRNAVASLQTPAKQEFMARITSGNLEPALGLLVAELRTSRHVDDRINDFVDRHMRFYYDDVIGQKPAAASSERVLLHLGLSTQTAFLPEGTPLEARTDQDIVQQFVTEAPAYVSPARLMATAVLNYKADPRISFNATLGGITSATSKLTLASDKQPGDKLPKFQIFSADTTDPITMGLDISSLMLSLAEGTRWIEVSLNMKRSSNLAAASQPLPNDATKGRAEPDPDVLLELRSDPDLVEAFSPGQLETGIEQIAEKVRLVAETRAVTPSLSLIYEVLAEYVLSVEPLRLLLGRIATLSLIEREPFPSGPYWTTLYAKIEGCREALSGQSKDGRMTGSDHGTMIFEAFSQNPDGTIDYTPEDVFERLLGDAFDITLSTPEGMKPATVTQILPVQGSGQAGMTLRLRQDASMLPVTAILPDQAPTLSIRYAEAPRICPVSFFERYTLKSVAFRVKVEGVRSLAAFSDDGPVVPGQTFTPFGPRPSDGATFVAGNSEMAQKPVTDIGIDLVWADLPDTLGGFETHYKDYARGRDIPAPMLSVDYLSGDGWKQVSQEPLPLFKTRAVTGALLPEWRFDGAVQGHPIPAQGRVKPSEYGARQTIRAGAIRMTLSGTGNGFQAEQYPLALVDAMRPRLLPFGERRIPPAPFLPKVDAFSLSYTASSTLEINAPDAANPGERIVQVGPFGKVEVFPERMRRNIGLFPERLGYGHLFMQLDGPGAKGPLVLLFDMAESGHLRIVPEPNPIKWFYLTQTGWTVLPDTSISSDTTTGLMRSGLVMIDMPSDAVHQSSEMPGEGVWIAAVATKPWLGIFPALNRVETNGVWAVCTDGSYHGNRSGRETGRVWAFNPPQPGLGQITEVPTPAIVSPPEAPKAYVARMGERLRHRKRAVTPWDVERLVLQEFPEVWMTKCLPHLIRQKTQAAPGHATLVVVPKYAPAIAELAETDTKAAVQQMFDAATLRRIRTFVAEHASGFADFDVVNPSYERLQVRAKLAFDHFRDDGAMAQRLKEDLTRYLSVWTAPRALGRFGWSLNLKMLHAHIRALGYVRSVADFSVLHLAADDSSSHILLDTAQSDGRGPYGPILRGSQPWSLPLSASDHALTILPVTPKEDPIQSGIGRLSVGDMLIVGQRTSS